MMFTLHLFILGHFGRWKRGVVQTENFDVMNEDRALLIITNSFGNMQWRIYIVKFWTRAPPPWGSKFFQFHAVFGEIWQNRMLAPPPGELAPPPRGNPGSATDMYHSFGCNGLQRYRY